jgi:putative membrane-bound dehydrogenase-like protein
MAIDDRGRLWVAENYTYPIRSPEGRGKDRILVFEDTKGTGRFDKRTVFMEGLNLVSGLEVGFGGVWVGAAPYLMFIPVSQGDEPKPAGSPQMLLDGFSYEDTHQVLSTFAWGPDGWLYGCEGVGNASNVGPPGAPANERTKMDGGVWRYHPTRHKFELFAEGTSNPWGMDFDEHGQCLVSVCVIPHLFHLVQGGRFTRMYGSHLDPYAYDDIKTVADHLHWDGDLHGESWQPWQKTRTAGALGGGHSHAGLVIYQGGSWPEQFRGKLFMNNLHGLCINMDVPERQGSGLVAHHGQNFLTFDDPQSLVLNLQTGPDGSVYMIDWYDPTHCYTTNPAAVNRDVGRIYKISYPATLSEKVDLRHKSVLGLIDLLDNKNNWIARHAQRMLQERAGPSGASPELLAELKIRILDSSLDPILRLRYVWALGVMDGPMKAKDSFALLQQISPDASAEYMRAWLIQFLCEDHVLTAEEMGALSRWARDDKSPVVRLYIASALQRLPVENRWDILAGLYSHAEDSGDHNLPLMEWYAAEALPPLDPARALHLAESAKLPHILEFTVRRTMALGLGDGPALISKSLQSAETSKQALEILNGLNFAFQGQRLVSMPQGWTNAEAHLRSRSNREVLAALQSLSMRFGSPLAIEAARQKLADHSADPDERRKALSSLLDIKAKNLAPLLEGLLDDATVREAVLQGLGEYDDVEIPQKILFAYPTFNLAEKRAALRTLTSRFTFARELMAAIDGGTVPRQDVTAELVRQLRSLKNPELMQLIAQRWGTLRESSAEKKALIEKYRLQYLSTNIRLGNPYAGRDIFLHRCQQCHTLFGQGGKVGPDLTGSNRHDLNFLLESIIDPSAVIPKDYRGWTLVTDDDRTITGILDYQDDKIVTLRVPGQSITVPRSEIKSLEEGSISFMPEGLLEGLSDEQVHDLLFFLNRNHR